MPIKQPSILMATHIHMQCDCKLLVFSTVTRKRLIHMDTVGRGLTRFFCYLTNIQTMTTVLTIFITSYSSLLWLLVQSLSIYCYFIAIPFLIRDLILVILSLLISTDLMAFSSSVGHRFVYTTYESISHNFHIYSQNFYLTPNL